MRINSPVIGQIENLVATNLMGVPETANDRNLVLGSMRCILTTDPRVSLE